MRIRKFSISKTLLIEFVKSSTVGFKGNIECVKGIPEDSNVVYTLYDFTREVFDIFIESESFPDDCHDFMKAQAIEVVIEAKEASKDKRGSHD